MLQENITRLSLQEVFANNVERSGSEYYIFERVDQHEDARVYKAYRFNYFTNLLVKSGAVNIKLNLTAYYLKADQLLLLAPGIVHKVTGFILP